MAEASDPAPTTDRAAALAEAYKRGLLPADMKAAYEEAMKRGLVAKAEPSKFKADQDKQRADDEGKDVKVVDGKRYVKGKSGLYAPEESADHPKWDPVGDIGRSFTSAAKAIPAAASRAFPSPQEALAADAANRDKYGAVGGTLKSAIVDPVSRLGTAATIPLNALGMLASPVTGGLHGTLGSALSELPTFNKEEADETVDKASMALPPLNRLGMAGGPIAAGTRSAFEAQQARIAASDAARAKNAAAVQAQPALAQARKAGYAVHPAETDHPGVIPNALAQMGGKIKTEQAASVHNQKITNDIAARDLGLAPGTQLDEAVFSAVRGRAANAYKVIENTASKLPTGRIVADNTYLKDVTALDAKSSDFVRDFPEAAAKRSEAVKHVQDAVLKQDFSPAAGVEMIRDLRDDARVNMKNWTDTDKVRTGIAQREAANAIEDLVERNLVNAGDAKSVAEYKAARQTIAKSHDVEAVTDAKGNVDARKLASLGDKRPLTGGLKTIADTAGSFPKSMQNPTKFGGLEKRSVLDTFGALASGAGAMATHNPLVALPGLMAMVARPAARTAALSDRIQNSLLGLRKANQAPAAVRQGAGPALGAPNALRSMQQGQPGIVQPQPAPSPVPQQQPQ